MCVSIQAWTKTAITMIARRDLRTVRPHEMPVGAAPRESSAFVVIVPVQLLDFVVADIARRSIKADLPFVEANESIGIAACELGLVEDDEHAEVLVLRHVREQREDRLRRARIEARDRLVG